MKQAVRRRTTMVVSVAALAMALGGTMTASANAEVVWVHLDQGQVTYTGTSSNDKVVISYGGADGPRLDTPRGTPVVIGPGCRYRGVQSDSYLGTVDAYTCSVGDPYNTTVKADLGAGNDTLESAPKPTAGNELAYETYNTRIDAGAGNDKVRLPDLYDFVLLGPGNDYTWTRTGGAFVDGGDGSDRISTGGDYPANDWVVDTGTSRDGTGLNDKVWTSDGDDLINMGAGRDKIDSGDGGDTIRAKDGYKDKLQCGLGFDRAEIDTSSRQLPVILDKAKNCELAAATLPQF